MTYLWRRGHADQLTVSGVDVAIDRLYHAGVAQLAEQLICNQQVGGSIPFASSISISGGM